MKAIILVLAAVMGGHDALAGEQSGNPAVNVATCRGCHGIAEYRTAFPDVYSVPRIGGQQVAYLVKALQDYRQGLRPYSTMQGIAAELSDRQIAAIAAYYAGIAK